MEIESIMMGAVQTARLLKMAGNALPGVNLVEKFAEMALWIHTLYPPV